MSCWDRFDMKISLCFTGNRDRVPPLDAELARVGLKPDLRIWNVPSPHELLAVQLMRPTRTMLESAGFRNSGFGHWRAVKTAYELGAGTVLVMEDDIRFLKDVAAVEETVETMPSDWNANVWMFDLTHGGRDDMAAKGACLDANRRGRWSFLTPDMHPRSLACYAMDRDGMAEFLKCCEDAFAGRRKFRIVDHYLDPAAGGLRLAVAWPLAAIQVPVGTVGNSAAVFRGDDRFFQYRDYEAMGVKLSDYNLPG